MKLNRKGYMAVEIILASVVSITIAVFLISITVKLVSKTDDYYTDTIFVTDKALLTKNIKEKIEADISNNGTITNINCQTKTNCTITYTNNTKKELSIDDNNIKYDDYIKEVDSRLTGNIEITPVTSENKTYILITITFTNIFENNNYNVTIPITNISEEKIKNYKVELNIIGYYGNTTTTITFDNSDYGPMIDIFDSWDQYFKSSTSETSLVCYEDKDKKTEYDFETKDTIRYQGYSIDFTTSIPNELFCDFRELN